MIDKNYMKRRFKCRCYQKDNTVKIYDGSEILFDVSYRDFDDAFYLSRKLQSVIMELNELSEENQDLHKKEVELGQNYLRLLEENEQLKQRNKRLEYKIQRERTSFTKTHERWSKEAETKIKELSEENEQLKTKNNAYIQDIEVFKEENQSLKFQLDECQNHKLFSRRELEKENEQLKKDLIDHSALISMLEDYQALKIEETLWNLTGAKSEEEFNELYEPYLEKAKRCWG